MLEFLELAFVSAYKKIVSPRKKDRIAKEQVSNQETVILYSEYNQQGIQRKSLRDLELNM
jgi:hypothetical protein